MMARHSSVLWLMRPKHIIFRFSNFSFFHFLLNFCFQISNNKRVTFESRLQKIPIYCRALYWCLYFSPSVLVATAWSTTQCRAPPKLRLLGVTMTPRLPATFWETKKNLNTREFLWKRLKTVGTFRFSKTSENWTGQSDQSIVTIIKTHL